MQKSFYLRLALNNLKNNRSTYLPYMLSCSTIIALFYMLHATKMASSVSTFRGAGYVNIILSMGCIIAGLVSVCIVFYTNSFLIKRRQKELGLYSVLGMEKRHIAHVLFCELAVMGIACMAVGIGGGMLFNQLVFMCLLDLVHMPADISFPFQPFSTLTTLVLFFGVFVLMMLCNLRQLHLSNPISLLRAQNQGEREPKAKWLIAVLGVLALGGGYTYALSVKTASDALAMFFPAVLLVVIGTYLLFTAGSIALLKLMRKNKKFYYSPNNFIAVSGMLHRMKQNAMGLANICILSTCLLVTLSSTLCLYMGAEDTLVTFYPHNVMLRCQSDAEVPLMARDADKFAQANGVTIKDAIQYRGNSFMVRQTGETFSADAKSGDYYYMSLLPLEDYNAAQGLGLTLSPGSVLLYDSGDKVTGSQLYIGANAYPIEGRLEQPDFLSFSGSMYESLVVVTPDVATKQEIITAAMGSRAHGKNEGANYDFNLEGSDEAKLAFVNQLHSETDYFIEDIFTAREDFYEMYGSLMFLGVFFVLLFLITTILIIYYKQVSEGRQDRERFRIMCQVGMGEKEVKQAIRKQVLLVFFLPLLAAMLHMAFAFPALRLLLQSFQMYNVALFLACTAGTALLFIAVYFIVYQCTSRTYYKLIRQDNRTALAS